MKCSQPLIEPQLASLLQNATVRSYCINNRINAVNTENWIMLSNFNIRGEERNWATQIFYYHSHTNIVVPQATQTIVHLRLGYKDLRIHLETIARGGKMALELKVLASL